MRCSWEYKNLCWQIFIYKIVTLSNKIVTVYHKDTVTIPGIYRHYFRRNNNRSKCKKWAAGLLEVRQPCQPKNDTYETLCVISNQTLNICREQVHHV